MTKLIQIDAFTSIPFQGNPAAVCLLNKPREESWMQAIAAEMNLSETAFLAPGEDPFSRAYQLRWFTPKVEVDLCGHATLAAAHALWTEGYLKPTDAARFDTRSGRLTAVLDPSGWITLDFPAVPADPVDPPPELLPALGLEEALFIGRSRFDLLIDVSSPAIVRSLDPDFRALSRLDCRGVIVTSRGEESFDFISRFFAPASGIDEDPVTGSAHCTLGPYWAGKLGKEELLAHQASPRGGVIRVQTAGDRVRLSGQAVTVLRGELVDPERKQPGPDLPRREERKFNFEED